MPLPEKLPALSDAGRGFSILLRAALASAILFPAVAVAQVANQKPEEITVELNKIESQGAACRTYFVVRNGMTETLSDLRLDVFVFDQDGIVARRFAMGTGHIRPGKTVVKLFDVPDLDCGTARRFLVNDVLSCTTPEGPLAECGERVTAVARDGLIFEY